MESAPSNPPVVVVNPQRQTVLWVIALLLAVNATALLTRSGGGLVGLPAALADSPMAGARGIFAFTGPIDASRTGLFMMDVDTRNVWCYEYLPSTRKLRLVFARSFDFDRYLDDFGLDPDTTPAQVRRMLDERRRIKDRDANAGTAHGEPEGSLSTNVPGLPPQEETQPASTSQKP